MLERFKRWLKEAKQTPEEKEAEKENMTRWQVEALTFVENMDKAFTKIDADSHIKKSTKTGVTIHMFVETQGMRPTLITEIKSQLKAKKIEIIPGKYTTAVAVGFMMPAGKYDNPLLVHVEVKPGGAGGKADPNELMTAALLLTKVDLKQDLNDFGALATVMEEAKKAAMKVVGKNQKQLDKFEGDFTNMAQAISAARVIEAWTGEIDEAFMTASGPWPKKIARFQREANGMKDFNSSDLVVRKGKKYFGISLKKKPTEKSPDPTVLNKAFSSIFNKGKGSGAASSSALNMLEKAIAKQTDIFFNKIINAAIKKIRDGKKVEGFNLTAADLDKIGVPKKLKNDQWKSIIKNIENSFVNNALRGNASIFKAINNIVLDEADMIAEQLIKLVLKMELIDLKNQDFEFALVTGVGKIKKDKPDIQKGELIDLPSIIETMDSLFDSGKVKMTRDDKQQQAYEEGATQAKIFYTVWVGKTIILDVQIRYKGNFSAQPQFQVTLSKPLKALLKGKKEVK